MRFHGSPLVVAGLMLSAAIASAQQPAPASTVGVAGADDQESAVARTLSVSEYALRLEAIAEALRAADLAPAGERASELRTLRVTWQQEPLAVDQGLLEEVRLASAATARPVAARLERLARELRAHESSAETAHARQDVLQRVRPGDDLTPGGDVDPHVPKPQVGAWPQLEKLAGDVAKWVSAARDRISQWLDRIGKWLERLWPLANASARASGQLPLTTWVVIAVVTLAAVALVVLAVRAVRRQPRDTVGETPPALSARRDDDPLSREANEWEQYAETLGAAGRRREAIRAWYHAVLVTLFRTGRLHYAKGRTNWEYVAALAPELAWRATFIELTRLFDCEWYGHEASSAAALATCTRQGRAVLRAARATGASA